MRAWSIVLFVLAIHAVLAMFNSAGVGNGVLDITIDTTQKSGSFIVYEGSTNVTLPSSDPQFFDEEANGTSIRGDGTPDPGIYNGGMIESITGIATTLTSLIGTFGAAIFSIHTLLSPYFGDFNAWIVEGMVDIIFAISLFQIVTGRSFRSME